MAVEGTGYKGFSEVDPNARIDKELTQTEGDKKNQPASASMAALIMLPGVNPGAIGTGMDHLLLPFHFLGSPQVAQNPPPGPKLQEGTKKTDEKKEEPNSGGIKITAGEPKEPEGKEPPKGA